MYSYSDIRTIHLEITEKCQAACPMCDRNQNGGAINPHLTMAELSLEDCQTIFSPEFIKQLDTMYMCGNYGDPMIAKDTLEVFEYFRKHNPNIWLSMNTNAGGRNKEWWTELAKVFDRKGAVIFSLDGLEDTNHLYRQNVDWNKCMQSADAFIGAGGRARWDYLIFQHNEHQVEEAEQLANKMGFEKFIKKKTGRFFSTASNKGKDEHQSFNRKGNKTTILKKPEDIKHLNKAITKEGKLIEKYGSIDNYYDAAPIKCKVQEEKSIYISAQGILMPCCWTAGRMYKWWMKPKQDQIWDFIENVGGLDSLNTKKNSIEQIMNSGFLQDIENSWNKPSCASGKLKVCSMKCGVEFDPFGEQFK